MAGETSGSRLTGSGEAQFMIGDDDDDDDNLIDEGDMDNDDISAKDNGADGGVVIPDGETSIAPPPAEAETEIVEITHPVARGDTLMSIARKYATDVSIPHSTSFRYIQNHSIVA